MEISWQNELIETSALPQLAPEFLQHHPVRYKRMRFLITSILLVPLMLTPLIIALVSGKYLVLLFSLGFLLMLLTRVAAINLGFPKRGYTLRERDITYAKGWFVHSVTTIPFNRIQHSEVSQGPIERRYKLSTLKIYTAGGSSSDLSIPGLEADEAQVIRDFISKKVAVHA